MSDITPENTKARYSDEYAIVPKDIVMEEILLKLPAKDLVRFKVVSKSWYEEISSPSFAKLHLEQSKVNTRFLIYSYPFDKCCRVEDFLIMEKNGETSHLSLLGFPEVWAPVAICSFNGMLCISNETEKDDLEIRICNPTTREVALLPSCSLPVVGKITSLGVVFNSKKPNYKVFRFLRDESESEDDICECEVYESCDGIWRGIGRVPQGPSVKWFTPMSNITICVKGRLYWLTWNKEDTDIPDFIQSVDMNGKFSRISLPENMNGYTFLIDLDGVLSVVSIDDTESYVDIFVLKGNEETGFTWSWKATGENLYDCLSTFNSVIGGKDEILFIFEVLNEFHSYVFYLTERAWREVDIGDALHGHTLIAFPFTESLLPCIPPQKIQLPLLHGFDS